MEASSGKLIVHETPKLDLEAYIANYAGPTRLQRLAYIGLHSTQLGTEALRMAVIEAKRGKDVQKYLDLTGELDKVAPEDSLAVPDMDWADKKVKEIKAEGDRLEQELKGYKNNLIKESIRMGNEDLGSFYYSAGDYLKAYNALSRMRDYCTTPTHIAQMCVNLILVAIAQRNWLQVQQQAVKLQALNLRPEEKTRFDAIAYISQALAQMCAGSYKEAALTFSKADPSFATADPVAGRQFRREVLTANDVAIYGGLCALASFDRGALQTLMLDNPTFRNFLELEPQIRRAIGFFCGSKYSQCLEILESYRADYMLDIYLASHVPHLFHMIRSKSIVQWFVPFTCVRLDEVAKTFAGRYQSGEDLEQELIEMIRKGTLNARLDLVDKLLVQTTPSPRQTVHASALAMAQDYERTLKLRLMRINMAAAGFEVRVDKNQPAAGRTQRGGY